MTGLGRRGPGTGSWGTVYTLRQMCGGMETAEPDPPTEMLEMLPMGAADTPANPRSQRRRMLSTKVAAVPAPSPDVDEAEALPGELEPLEWTAKRGPVTEEEALGVLRRRRRNELAQAPKREGAKRAEVPSELPPESARKVPVVNRFPPRYLAIAHARAELEGTNLTAILEEMLVKYATGAPTRPETVSRRLMGLYSRTK